MGSAWEQHTHHSFPALFLYTDSGQWDREEQKTTRMIERITLDYYRYYYYYRQGWEAFLCKRRPRTNKRSGTYR